MSKPGLKTTVIASVILAGLIPVSGMALDIKEGKWAFTTSTTNPMTGQPTTETTEECVMDSYDPLALMEENMSQMGTMCDVEPVTDAASEFEANISCPLPENMGAMSGNVSFTTDGNNATGKVAMSMNMGGMAIEINVDTVGEYLGACD